MSRHYRNGINVELKKETIESMIGKLGFLFECSNNVSNTYERLNPQITDYQFKLIIK